jgi:GAF domain-containing protein
MEDDRLGADRKHFIETLKEGLGAASSRSDGIRRVVEAIRASNPLYDWTGVYLLEGSELVLAHEIGAPTPHRRITLDRGICGAAAREGVTIVVDDVHADPRYLACTLETRSEIVVPLKSGGRILGEIDIDSDRRAAFTPIDRERIEAAAGLLSDFIERVSWPASHPPATSPRPRAAGGEGR